MDRNQTELRGLIETRWRAATGDQIVECTIHRYEGGYALLASSGEENRMRVLYTDSLDVARSTAAEWLQALMDAGFTQIEGPVEGVAAADS